MSSDPPLTELASMAVAVLSRQLKRPISSDTRRIKRRKPVQSPDSSLPAEKIIRIKDLVIVDVEENGEVKWDFGIVQAVNERCVTLAYLWEPKTVARALNQPAIIKRNQYFYGSVTQKFPRDEILHVLAQDFLQIAGTFDGEETVEWKTSSLIYSTEDHRSGSGSCHEDERNDPDEAHDTPSEQYGHCGDDAADEDEDDIDDDRQGGRPVPWDEPERRLLESLRSSGLTWAQICQKMPSRTTTALKKQWYRMVPTSNSMGRWTIEEDRKLKVHMEAGLAPRGVSSIIGRNPRSCRERWRYLNQGLKHWSKEEDLTLLDRQKLDLDWKQISHEIPGTSDKDCLDRWHSLQIGESLTRMWTPDEELLLKDLRSDGRPWEEVVDRLPGRTLFACKSKAAYCEKDWLAAEIPGRSKESRETRYSHLMDGKEPMQSSALEMAQIDHGDKKQQNRMPNGQTYPLIGSPELERQLVWAILQQCYIPYNSNILPNLLPGQAAALWEKLKSKEGWYEKDWRLVDMVLREETSRLNTAQQSRWTSILATAEAVHNGATAAEDREKFAFGLLQHVIDRFTCRTCNKMFAKDLAAHEIVCKHEDFSICFDCDEYIEPNHLFQHYKSRHDVNINAITIEAYWAQRNHHLLPQLDLRSGYGRYLTTRSPVSGPYADPEVRKLWSILSTNPMALEGERKWDLIQKHRESFEALFDATPVRFHQHVSDITPPSIHSMLQTLQNESIHRSKELKTSKRSPNFACTMGSFGSCYGGGANTSSLAKARLTACGLPYVEIQTTGGQNAVSIEKQLLLARKKGCFALIVEIVRWKDGRVMLPDEWSNIREACKKSNVVLIVDETMTLLRCGKPFAFHRIEYKGRPDLVFFGKGLNTGGVALDWQGPWLSKLELTVAKQEEAYTNLQIISDILETGCAIRSLGIIRLALKENWAERSLRIGRVLTDFASMSSDGKTTGNINIQGLGCLLYLKASDIFHHSVQSAGAGMGAVRWIPVLDNEMEDVEKLEARIFGPLSKTHRKLLGEKLSALGLRPSVCSFCGDHCLAEGAFFCSQCCVAICKFCRGDASHQCI